MPDRHRRRETCNELWGVFTIMYVGGAVRRRQGAMVGHFLVVYVPVLVDVVDSNRVVGRVTIRKMGRAEAGS